MTALPPRPTHNFNPLRFTGIVVKTDEERRRLIEIAAYKRAEQRGFSPGHDAEDWLLAETEVDRQIFRSIIGNAW